VIAQAYKLFWQYALSILAQRDYCEQQMRQKLQQRDAPIEAVEQIVHRLQALDYLNELRFTQNFFRLQLQRSQSLRRVAYKAKQLGVQHACIDIVFQDLHGQQDNVAVCKQLILKRDAQQFYRQDYKQKVRVMHFLQRRGYDADSISRAFFELEQET